MPSSPSSEERYHLASRTPAAPTKRSAFPIAAVVILAVVGGIRGMDALADAAMRSRPTGMRIDGRPLLTEEVKEGAREIVAMTRGAKAGDPASLKLATAPKTKLGQKFKQIAARSQAIDRAYARARGNRAVGDLLTPDRIGTPAGRKRSRAELTRFVAATRTYFAGAKGLQSELFALFDETKGLIAPPPLRLKRELIERETALMDLLAQADEVLTYAEQEEPTLRKGVPQFASVATYNGLAGAFNAAADAYESDQRQQLAGRQRKLDHAVTEFDRHVL